MSWYEVWFIDLSRIPTNNGTESRFGWTKMQQMYENVHPSLALVLLFVRTEVECGKGLLRSLVGLITGQMHEKLTSICFYDLANCPLSLVDTSHRL